jgi:hypothetical protein
MILRSILVAASMSFALMACSRPPSAPATPGSRGAASATAERIGVAGDPCEAVFEARVAQAKVPFIARITVTQRGAAMRSESRHVDGRSYALVDGAWRSTPMSIGQMVADLAQARANSRQTCRTTADEVVEGEPAAVFDVHVAADGTTSDNRLWVSKKTGLPLQARSIIDAGQTVEQTFSYVGVAPPAQAS